MIFKPTVGGDYMGRSIIFSFKDNYADIAVIYKGINFKSIKNVIRIKKYSDTKRGGAPYATEENLLTIQKFMKDAKVKNRDIDVILNWDNVITRVIETAVMSKKELRNFIDNNIEEYFAVSMKEYSYDYEILSIDKSGENKKMSILLAAVQKIKLKEILDFFSFCSLNPKVIDIYPNHILNLFVDESDKSLAVLDMNNGKSTLTMLDEGSIFLYSNISNESYDEDEIEFAEIAENVEYFLNFYAARHFGKKIDKIYVLGELYNNESLINVIRSQSSIETKSGLDGKNLRSIDKGEINSLLYGDILGHTISIKNIFSKDINFLEKLNEKGQKEISENKAIVREVIVLSAITITMILITLVYSKIINLKYDISTIDKQVVALNTVENELNKLEIEKSKYQNKVNAMKKIEDDSFDYIDILEAIKSGLPEDIYLKSISLDEDNVDITFNINNSTLDAARAIIAVNNMGIFEPVELPSVKLNDDVKEISVELKLKKAHKDVEVDGQK